MRYYPIVNAIAYDLGWVAAVFGAAKGYPWLGPVYAAAMVAFHLRVMPDWKREAKFLALVAAYGLVVDSALSLMGVFHFLPGQSIGGAAPLWLVSLWIMFGTMFNGCLPFLRRRWVLLAVSGGVLGPLAYWIGTRIGAMTLGVDLAVAIAALALVWGVTFPLLSRVSEAFAPPAQSEA